MTRRYLAGGAAGFGALLVLSAGEAVAESWILEPSVGLTERYDDNVKLETEADGPVESWSTTARAEVGLRRSTETTEARALARIDGVWYAKDDPDLDDTVNQVYFFDGTSKGERVDWGVQANLRRDSLIRTADVFDDPGEVLPEPGEDVDEFLVERSVTRDRISLEPRVEIALSETSDLRFSARSYTVNYDDDTTDLSEYQYNTLQGEWAVDLSEKDRLSTILRGSNYDNEDTNEEYDSVEALIGLRRGFTETTSAGFFVGVQRTEFGQPNAAGDDEETGGLLRLFGNRSTGETRYSVNLARSLTPSGSGDLMVSDELSFKVDSRISEKTNISLRSRYFQAEAVDATDTSANRTYLSLEPMVRYNLSEWWQLRAGYRFQRQKRDDDNDSAESNMFMLALTYSKARALE